MDKVVLNEEALEKVAGGIAEVDDDPQEAGRCPYCATLLTKSPYGYVCKDCGSIFDKSGKQVFSEVKEVK